MWLMDDAFVRARAAAANLPQEGERGAYTAAMLREDFPQLFGAVKEGDEAPSLAPETILEQFIAQANGSVLPSRWGSLWRYAAGLYIAHFTAMYLRTYAPEGSDTPAQAAARAQQTGVVKTASMGDTSISYDNSAITAATEKWGAWNATQYGQQLVTLARLVGMGGMYAI